MKRILVTVFAALLIVSCAKQIPPPRPFSAEAAFEEANTSLEKKNFDDARQAFEEIRFKDTENLYAPLAQLRIADSYVAEGEPELAVDEYREFLRDFPRHKYASYAQYQIAMVYYNQIQGPDRGRGAAVNALDAFEDLERSYPRNPYREDVSRKVERVLNVLAEHEFMVGSFYFKKRAYKAASDRFKGLLEDFPDYKDRAEVLYRLSVSCKGLGEDAKAEEYFRLLSEEYPGSPLIEKTEKEFAKLRED